MLAVKLAFRNLMGAGLRTWLNVIVLSLSFVVIIWNRGLLEGWNQQARHDTIEWDYGGGQYWHQEYDRYDPFTISDSHGKLPNPLLKEVEDGKLTPILLSQATIYPGGRMQSIVLKGIEPEQNIIQIPANLLKNEIDEIPAIIGTRMARNNRLQMGDYVTVRWRDVNGTFDAAEAKIVGIYKTDVPATDNGQMWIPLEKLRAMLQMPGEATILISQKDYEPLAKIEGWDFKNHDFLLADIDQIIEQKSVGGTIMYIILMSLALLAIFDTQVLSIFRRQKEIGTDIALGMTRWQVVRLFTVEGAMHAILAALVGALYGIPLLSLQAVRGFSLPQGYDDYGLAIADKIYPVYSFKLILMTIVLVLITVTIVSFLPARRITKMNPTDAIRGKIQ